LANVLHMFRRYAQWSKCSLFHQIFFRLL